jgi:RNA polymerase sigma-70 factor (ECF subfamily)
VSALRVVSREERSLVDESKVIENVLAGNADAFGYFVKTYQKRIYSTAARLLRDFGEAECVAQESFLKAYQALGDFRGGCSFETWLTRIAINTCRDRLKRKRVILYFHQAPANPEDQGEPDDFAVSPDPSPERLLHSRQIRKSLLSALETLSARQRVVFVLKHLEERSIPEIAELLGLDCGTVKSHLFRAAAKIRRKLKDLRKGNS